MISKLVLLLACICTFIHAVSVECPYTDALKAQEAKGASESFEIDLAQRNPNSINFERRRKNKKESNLVTNGSG